MRFTTRGLTAQHLLSNCPGLHGFYMHFGRVHFRSLKELLK